MLGQNGWGAAPNALVCAILWSDQLDFRGRFYCQQVCKLWNNLLHERPSGLLLPNLPHDLCVIFTQSGTESRIEQQQQVAVQLENPPAILMVPDDRPASLMSRISFSACCYWLMVQAPLIRKVQVSGHGMSPWQLQKVVSALQLPPPQIAAAVDITIPLGETLTRVYSITPHLHAKQRMCARYCMAALWY